MIPSFPILFGIALDLLQRQVQILPEIKGLCWLHSAPLAHKLDVLVAVGMLAWIWVAAYLSRWVHGLVLHLVWHRLEELVWWTVAGIIVWGQVQLTCSLSRLLSFKQGLVIRKLRLPLSRGCSVKFWKILTTVVAWNCLVIDGCSSWNCFEFTIVCVAHNQFVVCVRWLRKEFLLSRCTIYWLNVALGRTVVVSV